MSSNLAIVCLMPEAKFKKQGLIDYNIDCFKAALTKVISVKKGAASGAASNGGSNGSPGTFGNGAAEAAGRAVESKAAR